MIAVNVSVQLSYIKPAFRYRTDDEDFEWEPPTEAEMKVIQARRERQDKISKLMGDYLLKGYKMLGECCDVCGVSQGPLHGVSVGETGPLIKEERGQVFIKGDFTEININI